MRVTENSCLVIFGASGDLAARKLIPALLHLFQAKYLPEDLYVLGVSRSDYDDQRYRERLLAFIEQETEIDHSVVIEFLERVYYHAMDPASESAYPSLKQRLSHLATEHNTSNNVLYYLATPPSLFQVIPEHLSQHGMTQAESGYKRLVVEKPIGYDLCSAEELDASLHHYFDEEQIYRIDHYLGKETVQNLLVFRFANGMFEPLWGRHYVEYVEITGAESLGVEGRGGYYENAGALRDMFQNHLLQVLAMVAMEPPMAINGDAVRDEVAKLLQSLHPLSSDDLENNLVLGQYTESKVRGNALLGYRQEEGVAQDSRTETFVALKLHINNSRWNGVPFFIRSGKRLPTRVTEVVIHFKPSPHPVFTDKAPKNKLVIRIQPDEGIVMKFGLKRPGAGFEAEEVAMDFHYQDLGETKLLSAYERLLLDALNGDSTLFARSDAVRACWKYVEPILQYKSLSPALYGYASGTWGPKEAFDLMARDGFEWRYPCRNLTDTDYCEL
ncbi:glucose-6-phosphate dehydrogenase [Oleiphilus sp. HI0009]|uniref:glucose-6-phosphate dehydrogenase n=1 Tax=unclassified Oleiphilus TaxID=2631174 RepID=UPI0007C2DABD|nr:MULTISPECIES: glucose-6-phosphate dehydrogenase [unclassified Oleiphilus]KZX82392.1 glucose-6-phosphate dehydrogenase [Oleiphilus sp. HI0009]KZY64344.1 glucose-6-phosphate dehydrogenase [Oleiphilus sp. HI0066]KZY67847.1 glucose-6-phosphate dehydrogenase [Oleiphilus sp. HI0067]